MMGIEELKKKLREYSKEEIIFFEPHFTEQLELREGKREEVINILLNPEKLVYVVCKPGKYGDLVHSLHFDISNTRTLILPVIFDIHNKKSLYILTYIMRHRKWHRKIRISRGRR